MKQNLNAPNLSVLGGRAVAVRVPSAPSARESIVPGVIEVRDVAGDQDGPAVVVVLDQVAVAARSMPRTIALDTATITRFLSAPPDVPLEITLS